MSCAVGTLPTAWMPTNATTKHRDYMTAHRSQNALLKAGANDVSYRANSEFANKRRYIETERAARLLKTLPISLFKVKHNNLQ
jgi:hypothetical protein